MKLLEPDILFNFNQIINMKLLFTLLMTNFSLSFQSGNTSNKDSVSTTNYELVKSWPQLSKDYNLGQPTGIGIDQNDHIFVFHRASRKWTNPFPDAFISENTLLELDNES